MEITATIAVNIIAMIAGAFYGIWMFRVKSSIQTLKRNSVMLNDAMLLVIEKMNEVIQSINEDKENRK